MGCSNVAGGMSNVSIDHGSDAVFFILQRTKNSLEPCAWFSNWEELMMPFCPPIRGKYDDYQKFQSVGDDQQTAYDLEAFFGLPIMLIVERINHGVDSDIHALNDQDEIDVERDAILASLYGMWEHESVYDRMIKHSGVVNTHARKGNICKRTLTLLNFRQVGLHTFQHGCGMYDAKSKLFLHTGSMYSVAANNPYELAMLTGAHIATRVRLNESYPAFQYDNWKESVAEKSNDQQPNINVACMMGDKTELVDLELFNLAMRACNCMYFPTANGSQDSNPDFETTLNMASAVVIENKYKNMMR